jgi:hypothetical protein
MTLKDLTTAQLNRIISIKEQIESLQAEIDSIASAGDGGVEVPVPAPDAKPARKKYKMSPAHRRNLLKALAKARKARWAKLKGTSTPVAAVPAPKEKKSKRTMSPAARAKIAASARARWKKAKAAGKKTL